MSYIPPEIRKTIDAIFNVEGGFNKHDKADLPTYRGITSYAWRIWVNSHPQQFHVHFNSDDEAAADLLSIAHRSGVIKFDRETVGKAHPRLIVAHDYTHLSRAQYEAITYDLTYQKYLVAPGFDTLNSIDVQKYLLEVSFWRGEDSARWALTFAAGVEPRHAEPLMINKDGVVVLPRSPVRDHAIAYANGFMATGTSWQMAPPGSATVSEYERRFYARLRFASVAEESHMVGNRGFDNLALGLFMRAFTFEWPEGRDRDNPGFDTNSEDDRHMAALYQDFLEVYNRYTDGTSTRAQFDRDILALSYRELCDPNSPMNEHRQPNVCRLSQGRFNDLMQKLGKSGTVLTADDVVSRNWPINSEEGRRLVGGATAAETRGLMEDYAANHGLNVGTFVNYTRDNPDGDFPVILAGARMANVQYARTYGFWPYGGHESIAIAFGNDSVIYDIDAKGNFLHFTHIPKGMAIYQKADGSGPPLLSFIRDNKKPADAKGNVGFIALSPEINQRIQVAGREDDYRPGLTIGGIVPSILQGVNIADRWLNRTAPYLTSAANAVIQPFNRLLFKLNIPTLPDVHLAPDLPTHIDPTISRNASIIPGVNGFRLNETWRGSVRRVWDDLLNSAPVYPTPPVTDHGFYATTMRGFHAMMFPDVPRKLDVTETNGLVIDIDPKLQHELGLVLNRHTGHVMGAPPGSVLPGIQPARTPPSLFSPPLVIPPLSVTPVASTGALPTTLHVVDARQYTVHPPITPNLKGKKHDTPPRPSNG